MERPGRRAEVTDELRALYHQAQEEGFFVWEMTHPSGFTAAVGDRSVLEAAGIDDVTTLELSDIFEVTMPGGGKTREEAVGAALADWREYKESESKLETAS